MAFFCLHWSAVSTILEYCNKEKCIEREDYYLCSLPHEYNILPKAGSWLGHKHSDETKTKISNSHKGKTRSDETKTKISDTMTGENNLMYGKKIIAMKLNKKISDAMTSLFLTS